ncbi:MAG: DUF4215 domain-containing protein [Myxococcales bacterium]|nr:MAG: DUF4215 domain-containing protein [Myxococcales bacterium]
MKVRLRAWLSLVLLGGCSSGGGGGPVVDEPWCGNQVVEEGEVCDARNDGDSTEICAFDCLSSCGNGTVEGPEVCDDGNTEDADGCSANCFSACGNGEVEEDETCDDGNDEPGDGCYQCSRPGDVRWFGVDPCDGKLSPGNEETFLLSCSSDPQRLYVRYALDGSRTEGPPPPLDPNEAYNTPRLLAEQPSGELYVVTQAVRNSTTANESRVRVYRLKGDGAVVWSRDLTIFPDGPNEWASALAVGEATVAVAGTTMPANSSQSVTYPYLALLAETGELLWKKTLTDLRYGDVGAVAVAQDGTVFAAGIWDLNLDTSLPSQAWFAAYDAEGAQLWARTTTLGLTGSVSDARLSGGELQVMLQAVGRDDLVPDPPRLTSTVEVFSLDATTGEATSTRLLAAQQTNGQKWGAVASTLRRGAFSSAESLDSYSYAKDAVVGYDGEGNEVFRSNNVLPHEAASVQGSLAVGDLLCLSFVSSESTPELSCYVTR